MKTLRTHAAEVQRVGLTFTTFQLTTVASFKNLSSVITDVGSKPEILSRIAQTTAALTRLKTTELTRVFLSAPRYD